MTICKINANPQADLCDLAVRDASEWRAVGDTSQLNQTSNDAAIVSEANVGTLGAVSSLLVAGTQFPYPIVRNVSFAALSLAALWAVQNRNRNNGLSPNTISLPSVESLEGVSPLPHIHLTSREKSLDQTKSTTITDSASDTGDSCKPSSDSSGIGSVEIPNKLELFKPVHIRIPTSKGMLVIQATPFANDGKVLKIGFVDVNCNGNPYQVVELGGEFRRLIKPILKSLRERAGEIGLEEIRIILIRDSGVAARIPGALFQQRELVLKAIRAATK